MLTKADFNFLLQQRGTPILDGALATELEARGQDLNHALWSGKVLRDDPDIIEQVHLDYFLAGADVAITASYQASTQGLCDHFGMSENEAKELIKSSVLLAQQARSKAYQSGAVSENMKLLVAGSVGPYGAYLADGSEYRGDYKRSAEEFEDFHRPRIQALVDAGVDILAVETIPSLPEIEAILALLSTDFPNIVAWLGCTLKDAEHLSDGAPMKAVIQIVSRHSQIVAFGVNCVPIQLVTPALQELSTVSHIPLLCYPNSGETWNAETKTWQTSPDDARGDLVHQAQQWRAAGARLIGGCCRTGPKDIKVIFKALEDG